MDSVKGIMGLTFKRRENNPQFITRIAVFDKSTLLTFTLIKNFYLFFFQLFFFVFLAACV